MIPSPKVGWTDEGFIVLCRGERRDEMSPEEAFDLALQILNIVREVMDPAGDVVPVRQGNA